MEIKQTNNKSYVIRCPEHKSLAIEATGKYFIPYQGKNGQSLHKYIYTFYCPKCKRTYVHTDNSFQVGTYFKLIDKDNNEIKCYYTNSKPYYQEILTKKSHTKSVTPNKRKSENNNTTTSNSALQDTKQVYFHLYSDEEMKKKTRLLQDYQNILKQSPDLGAYNLTFPYFFQRVFPSNALQNLVVINESSTGEQGLRQRCRLYNKDSSFLNDCLAENTYIVFDGNVRHGQFYPEGMQIWENPVSEEDEQVRAVQIRYGNPRREADNWLVGVTSEAAKRNNKLTENLTAWKEYLDWKEQLANLRIQGIKYIGVRFDFSEMEMAFLAVCEADDFSRFRKVLRSDDISAFPNNYSKNKLVFEFNIDDKGRFNGDSGVSLNFIRVEKKYSYSTAIDETIWDEYSKYTRQYKGPAYLEKATTSELFDRVNHQYKRPVYYELVFELTQHAADIVHLRRVRSEELREADIRNIASEFYSEGFLATSQIGDFALINRLRNSISDLEAGKCASTNLKRWMFDITAARKPSRTKEVINWHNPNLNIYQQEAVNKILSVPDVCLIQGPPGTGKTTVIAEAVFQLVNQNKRVLIASQANLAVDNALERLASDPRIRAVRLGNSRKINDSVRNITEENVLSNFYQTLIGYEKSTYRKEWKEDDDKLAAVDRDLERYSSLQQNHTVLQDEITSNTRKIKTINVDIHSETNESSEAASDLQNLQSLSDALVNSGSIPAISLSRGSTEAILKSIEKPISDLVQKGIAIDRWIRAAENDRERTVALEKTIRYLWRLDEIEQNVSGDQIDDEASRSRMEDLQARLSMVTDRLVKEGQNPELFMQWQQLQKQISAEKEQGNISEEDKALFGNEIQESTNVQEFMKQRLVLAKDERAGCKKACLLAVKAQLEACREQENALQDHINQLRDEKERLMARNIELAEEQRKILAATNNMLSTYKAKRISELSDAMENQKYAIRKQSFDRQRKEGVPRDEWEEIFDGLEKWVDDIPDYQSENEHYLKEYINGCNVVGVSCTESSRTLTDNGFDDFDVVIIDEVSKATPPELLVQMLHGRKIVLVGDHRQLPPLFNEHEKSYQEVAEQQAAGDSDQIVTLTMDDFYRYKDMVTASLFEQYFEHADDSIKETLEYQYRMHPDIMNLINMFYDGKLKDGNALEGQTDTKEHGLTIPDLNGISMIVPQKHAYWFDSSTLETKMIYEQQDEGSTSFKNVVEVKIIMNLLKQMNAQYMEQGKTGVQVGVISFYFDQVRLLRNEAQNYDFQALDVEINTVDRFQGKEKEIVLVSLVRNSRSSRHSAKGYVAAFQRINVAFSRAEKLLIIVGASAMFADQPVELTDMNNGEKRTVMAYRDIIDTLNLQGAYFPADSVLTQDQCDKLLAM